ncbi:MAG: hypothetical protein ACE5K4_04335 [Candidatus Hydrothermarchaeota archaeon]
MQNSQDCGERFFEEGTIDNFKDLKKLKEKGIKEFCKEVGKVYVHLSL